MPRVTCFKNTQFDAYTNSKGKETSRCRYYIDKCYSRSSTNRKGSHLKVYAAFYAYVNNLLKRRF